MARRTRIPGPIAQDQILGNTNERVPQGISKWVSVDPSDGSWTVYDPNSTLVSSSTSTSGFRFAVDKDKNSSSYRWTASNQGSVRWHKPLIGPDGQTLTWADFFSMEILIECTARNANNGSTGVVRDYHGVMVGIGGNGVTNATSGIKWVGQAATHQFASLTDGSGLKSIIGGTSGISNDHSSTCKKVYGVISAPVDGTDADGNPHTMHTYSLCLDANNRITNDGDDAIQPNLQGHEYTSSDNLYLFVGSTYAATVGLSSGENPEATWKIWYRLSAARDGLNPTYIPGGGESG